MNVHFDRALIRDAGNALVAWSSADTSDAMDRRAAGATALARAFGEDVRSDRSTGYTTERWGLVLSPVGWIPGVRRSDSRWDWAGAMTSANDAVEWIAMRFEQQVAAERLQAVRLALAAPFGAGAEARDVMDLAAELVAQHFARVASEKAPPSVRGHIERARQAVAEAQDALSPHRCPQSGTVSDARSQLDAAEKALDKAANGAGLIWAALDGSIEHNKRLMGEVERLKGLRPAVCHVCGYPLAERGDGGCGGVGCAYLMEAGVGAVEATNVGGSAP